MMYTLDIGSDSNQVSLDLDGSKVAITIAQFQSHLAGEIPQYGLLPPVTRYISSWFNWGDNQNRKYCMAIVEAAPCRRTVGYGSHERQRVFDIPVPWQQWVLLFRQGIVDKKPIYSTPYLYFSPMSMTSLDHHWSMPYLPNLYRNGQICLGGSSDYASLFGSANEPKLGYGDGDMELDQVYRDIATFFWTHPFNNDLHHAAITIAKHPRFKNVYDSMEGSNYLDMFELLERVSIEEVCDEEFFKNNLDCGVDNDSTAKSWIERITKQDTKSSSDLILNEMFLSLSQQGVST